MPKCPRGGFAFALFIISIQLLTFQARAADDGFALSGAKTDYSISKSNEISFDKAKFAAGRTSVGLLPMPVDPAEPESKAKYLLAFDWPTDMYRVGRLSLVDRKTKVLWSRDLTDSDLKKWQSDVESEALGLAQMLSDKPFGILGFDVAAASYLKNESEFRVCFQSEANSQEFFKACSPFYRVKQIHKVYKIFASQEVFDRRIFLGDNDSGNHGKTALSDSKPAHFKISFSNGSYVDFTLKSEVAKIKSATIESPTEPKVRVIGNGKMPIGAELQNGSLDTWSLMTSQRAATLEFAGQWGLNYHRTFNTKNLKMAAAPIAVQAPIATPQPAPSITPTPKPNPTATPVAQAKPTPTPEPAAQPTPQQAEEAATPQNTKGRHAVVVYPFELSTRLVILPASPNTVLAGETGAGFWPRSIFGWQNEYLSKWRWGFNLKYFQSFTNIQVNNPSVATGVEKLTPFNIVSLDERFSFLRGAWNHSQLLGLMLSESNLNAGTHTAALLGGGLYWARPLPQFLEGAFDLLPFLRYPKYVDLEAVYDFSSPTAGVQLKSTYYVNFHGKVFWRKSFFGELGFGYKSFNFSDKAGTTTQSNVNFQASYATLGVGFVF